MIISLTSQPGYTKEDKTGVQSSSQKVEDFHFPRGEVACVGKLNIIFTLKTNLEGIPQQDVILKSSRVPQHKSKYKEYFSLFKKIHFRSSFKTTLTNIRKQHILIEDVRLAF